MCYLTGGALNKFSTHTTAETMSQTEHALPSGTDISLLYEQVNHRNDINSAIRCPVVTG